MNDQVQEEFEDNHEDSEIFDYFRNIKADIPIHLFYLIIEIIIEIKNEENINYVKKLLKNKGKMLNHFCKENFRMESYFY